MNKFSFEEQLKRGKKFEKMVISFLNKKYRDKVYLDVSDKDAFKDIDVDALQIDLIDDKNRVNLIEIKCDETEYKSCNLFVENISCKRLNTNGWLKKTKADYICYFFTKWKEMYMIPIDVLRYVVNNYIFESREAYDEHKTSVGYIIPAYIFDEYKVSGIDDLITKVDDFYKIEEV